MIRAHLALTLAVIIGATAAVKIEAHWHEANRAALEAMQ